VDGPAGTDRAIGLSIPKAPGHDSSLPMVSRYILPLVSEKERGGSYARRRPLRREATARPAASAA
jgi:hypothetical protein